jgi:hypothetical protein
MSASRDDGSLYAMMIEELLSGMPNREIKDLHDLSLALNISAVAVQEGVNWLIAHNKAEVHFYHVDGDS